MAEHSAPPAGQGPTGPILAPAGASPAEASRPEQLLEGDRFNTYQSNPAPWWVAVIWLSFFIFGVIYLITNLVRG